MDDRSVRVRATGSYLPPREVLNSELTQFPRSALPLIEEKTGIAARRYAGADQCTSDLAFHAGVACLERAAFAAAELDAIVVATSSPDRMQPATATRVQSLLGAKTAFAFDINSVCSGGVYAAEVGRALIAAGTVRNALVIGAEVYSKILNPTDFSTQPYFGDGAGAMLLERGNEGARLMAAVLRTDGDGHNVVQVPAGGTMKPYAAMQSKAEQYFTMKGRDVFEFAVTRGPEAIRDVLQRGGIGPECVSWVVSHQANINIIRAIAAQCGIPPERFVTNLQKYGNTAGASVLIGFDELCRSGQVLPGQSVVLVAFGGGLSWGASVIQF